MATDAFLKLSTIPGDSTDDKYKDHIQVLSFHCGVSQPHSSTVSGAGNQNAGRADFHDFSIVKNVDKASPKLALACANGEHIKEGTLFLCRAGKDKTKYMEYKLTDVTVRAIRPGGSMGSGGDIPLEEVSFGFGKIEWTYTETSADGQKKGDIKAYWDLKTNKGG